MTKKLKSLAMLFALVLVTACTAANDPAPAETYQPALTEDQNNPPVGTISDFMPFEENTTFVIVNPDYENANQEIFTTFKDGERIQQRIRGHNIDLTLVLELSGGTLRQIYQGEGLYAPVFDNITHSIEPNMSMIMLQEPLSLNNFWDNGVGGVSTITDINVPVTTPVGTFTDTIEVTTIFEDGSRAVVYFAKGYGMVYDSHITTRFFNDADPIQLEFVQHLAEVRRGPLAIETPVFFANEQALAMAVDLAYLQLHTNQSVEDAFNNLLPQVAETHAYAVVNTITLHEDEQYVHIDFSEEILNLSQRVGSGVEEIFLDSIANIFGFFYNVPYVRISVDGFPYSTGHFSFEQGQRISVGQGLQ